MINQMNINNFIYLIKSIINHISSLTNSSWLSSVSRTGSSNSYWSYPSVTISSSFIGSSVYSGTSSYSGSSNSLKSRSTLFISLEIPNESLIIL